MLLPELLPQLLDFQVGFLLGDEGHGGEVSQAGQGGQRAVTCSNNQNVNIDPLSRQIHVSSTFIPRLGCIRWLQALLSGLVSLEGSRHRAGGLIIVFGDAGVFVRHRRRGRGRLRLARAVSGVTTSGSGSGCLAPWRGSLVRNYPRTGTC